MDWLPLAQVAGAVLAAGLGSYFGVAVKVNALAERQAEDRATINQNADRLDKHDTKLALHNLRLDTLEGRRTQ